MISTSYPSFTKRWRSSLRAIPFCQICRRAGHPPEENHTCWGIGIAATVLAELRKAGWPVTACFVPFEAACHLLVVTVSRDWKRRTAHRNAADLRGHWRLRVFAPRRDSGAAHFRRAGRCRSE